MVVVLGLAVVVVLGVGVETNPPVDEVVNVFTRRK